jgi:predicted DNA binding CopG/RHH family protein
MMKTKQVKKGTIQPMKSFQTLEEEAEYWDTQTILDEINEGTVVGFYQANKTDTLTIRFSHEDIQRLREEAVEQGVGPSTLARMLVKKGLRTL